ncbi:MAG TPA: PAS domain S-box protein [Azospirillaceae bacterium]|nr:PAS domain S-box protein [Azospirillaceae bacterium]HRQ80750.1 PAS domain S-box protein [Azospirillaceae bacterium]
MTVSPTQQDRGRFDHRGAVQAAPVVAMLLVVILLAAFLWLLHRNEAEEEAVSLIKNVLWVEQNLRFQLNSDEEKLRQMADALGRDETSPAATAAMRHFLSTNPATVRLEWQNADGKPVLTMPPASAALPAGALSDFEGLNPRQEAFHIARSLGRQVYSTPYRLAQRDEEYAFELVTPIFDGEVFKGALATVFSFSGFIAHHVPWWFAERYQLEVMDVRGKVLGAKTRLATADAQRLSHAIPFDPPGHGLSLVATVHASENNVARNVLIVAIFALTVSALWSLWAVRRHIRRRLDAEHALRAEHAFRKSMEDSLTVGMRARDLAGRVIYVNQAFCRMVGWTADELIGQGPEMPYWAPEEMEKTHDAFRAVMSGRSPQDGFELRFRRKNGERFDALIYESPLIDADGRQIGWMGSVLDVTERKRAEEINQRQQEKLQQTARLIAMGEMASALAHELNQPLSAIAGYSTGCLNRIKAAGAKPEDLTPALEKLAKQARRAGEIIRHIYDFVRKREPEVAPCDLAEVIGDSATLFSPDARKHRTTLTVQTPPDLPAVSADRILLQQVLINLMRNGCEAMAATPPDRRNITVTAAAADSGAVVRVVDCGPGVRPDIGDRLFTPFQSTKSEGMGMGLSICRSIIEHHGGRLWYEPNPGGGAMFVFSLPAARS